MRLPIIFYALTSLLLILPTTSFGFDEQEAFSAPQQNNFAALIKSHPMIVALFFQDSPGGLEAAFSEVSKTPRFRFAQIQFLEAQINQPGVVDVLQQNQLSMNDMPLIAIFRDGTMIRDNNGKVISLTGQTNPQELRDFVDDYFSEQIQNIMSYAKENPQNFAEERPSDVELYSDSSRDYQPAIVYQPIVYNNFTTFAEPLWWNSYYQSSYYRPYWRGHRHHHGKWSRPPWYRHNRPHHWNDGRRRHSTYGRRDGDGRHNRWRTVRYDRKARRDDNGRRTFVVKSTSPQRWAAKRQPNFTRRSVDQQRSFQSARLNRSSSPRNWNTGRNASAGKWSSNKSSGPRMGGGNKGGGSRRRR